MPIPKPEVHGQLQAVVPVGVQEGAAIHVRAAVHGKRQARLNDEVAGNGNVHECARAQPEDWIVEMAALVQEGLVDACLYADAIRVGGAFLLCRGLGAGVIIRVLCWML